MASHMHESHPMDADHLHLSDLPRWPVWLGVLLATALAAGLVVVIEEAMDAGIRDIAASALVRGVPPPAPPK